MVETPQLGTRCGVWGSGPWDLWRVGASPAVWRVRAGQLEQVVPAPPRPLDDAWTAVAGTGPDDVWVASARALAHWDGTGWRTVRTGTDRFVRALRVEAGRVWAVGEGETVRELRRP